MSTGSGSEPRESSTDRLVLPGRIGKSGPGGGLLLLAGDPIAVAVQIPVDLHRLVVDGGVALPGCHWTGPPHGLVPGTHFAHTMRVDPVQLRAVLKRPRDCSLSDSRTPQGHRQHNRKSEPAPPNRVEYDFLIPSSRAVRSVTPSLHKVASLGASSPPRAAEAGVPQVVVLAGRYGLNLRDCPIVQLGSAHAEVDEIAASAVPHRNGGRCRGGQVVSSIQDPPTGWRTSQTRPTGTGTR